MQQQSLPAFNRSEESDDDPSPARPALLDARLMAFYLSRERVLELLNPANLPAHIVMALESQDVQMAAAILSNAVGSYLLHAIAAGRVKTVPQLAFEGSLSEGAQFIYNGHVTEKGFGANNNTPTVSGTHRQWVALPMGPDDTGHSCRKGDRRAAYRTSEPSDDGTFARGGVGSSPGRDDTLRYNRRQRRPRAQSLKHALGITFDPEDP